MAFWQRLFLLSVTVGLARSSSCCECPPLWNHYGYSCYRFFGLGKTWEAAETHCQQFFTSSGQGHLASMHDSGEKGFINELWKTSLSTYGYHSVWIGLTDHAVEGKFTWSDKTTMYFKDWSAGQPDNYLNKEDCGTMRWNEDDSRVNGWNDDECTKVYSYICKMQAEE